MKKSILLLVAGAVAFTAGAQSANHSSVLFNKTTGAQVNNATKSAIPVSMLGGARHSAARTTNITSCSYSETFPSTVFTTGGSGGGTDIWTRGTTGSPSPGTWTYIASRSTSSGAIDALVSSTASDGWAIFNSDSLRGTTATNLPGGWMESPGIDCSSLTTVGLSFQQYFQGGQQDTCYIQVSQSSTFSSGITSFPVHKNNLNTYQTTANADTMLIDITSAAAGHIVYIRFQYTDQQGAGFSWQVDDVCVGALSAHDVSIDKEYLFEAVNTTSSPGANPSSIYERPLSFIDPNDSIYPVMFVNNFSHALESAVPLKVDVYGPAGAATYSKTVNYDLPSAAIDSGVGFDGYVPNVTGAYTVAFNAALTTDTDPGNNLDTATFLISDTTWNNNYGQHFSNYDFYAYGSGATPIEYFVGARFDVPTGVAGDTVSGFGVAFSSQSMPTNAGGTVMVQLYSQDPSSGTWTWQGSSVGRALATSDYNATSLTTIKYAYFPTFTGYGPNGGGNFVLSPNTSYAAVVQTNAVSRDLLVMATGVPEATNHVGYLGEVFPSSNDGGTTFGSSTATGLTVVPLINMYFNHIKPQTAGVTNVNNGSSIGEASPNPTNTAFSVPFTMSQDSKVTVTLTNIMGQVIDVQNVNAIGGQSSKATFNTTSLADGMYMYSVQANGQRTTGRVVVAH